MDSGKSGYCRDSDIPTAANKEIPLENSFVTQSVLCPGEAANNIGDTTVCDDTIEPALKGKTITLEYDTTTTTTITAVKFDASTDSGYTGTVLAADVEGDKTLINNILGEYKTVCESKKRVPRGSYLKATKTGDNSEVIYISDKNYIKTTTAGVTLIYSITKKEYLAEGSQYTIGTIDHANSGTCSSNKWTGCTNADTEPCNAQAPTPITITYDGSNAYSSTELTGYTISASNRADFETISSHLNCGIKNIKLAKSNKATIYVTSPDISNKVNVLVVDNADHVRVYTATSSISSGKVQTITVGEMNKDKSGYCRDSDIPTATGKEIPITNSFVTQSVLCPASGGNIGTDSVCNDANKPGNIEITYDGSNEITATVNSETGYTGTDATDDKTLIDSILGEYKTVCDSKKRVPRGSYLKASKEGEIIYISDKNYVKTTTTDGITLVYAITKDYLDSGSQYTIGAIDHTNSGKCDKGEWTGCKDATIAPCNAAAPTSPTITYDGTTYAGMAAYTIETSTAAEFNKVFGHTECVKEIALTALKLEKNTKTTVYVTKPDKSNKVNVIVFDNADHVRVYAGTSSLTDSVQTITVGVMDTGKSGYCRDSDIPTAANKEIPSDKSFVTQSVLCVTGNVIGSSDVCDDTITPALKGKTIEITYGASNTITAKVGDVADYAGTDATTDKTLIDNILGDYSSTCTTNSQTKKRVPRGSYLKATKTGDAETVYISDKYYIKTTTTDGITLVYGITKQYMSEGSKYTIGEIVIEKSGKCDNGEWTPCTNAQTAPCDAKAPTSPTITYDGTTYAGMDSYSIKTSTSDEFTNKLDHIECVKQEEVTTVVPPDTIMTYKIGEDIAVYLSDTVAVKEKGNEFLVYTVNKQPDPSTGTANGSKYEFSYQPDLSGECKENGLEKCKSDATTGLCSSTTFENIVVKYIKGENPSAKFDETTVITILSERSDPKYSNIKLKLEKYKDGELCEKKDNDIIFEGNAIPNELVMKHVVDGSNTDETEYYIYANENIFYRKDQKQISITANKENKSNYTIYSSEKVIDRNHCGFISDNEGNVEEIENLNCAGMGKNSFLSIEWLKYNCDFDEENITTVFNTSNLELKLSFISNGTIENSKVYLYESENNKISDEYGILINKESSGIIFEDISMRIEIPYLLLILILSILLFQNDN